LIHLYRRLFFKFKVDAAPSSNDFELIISPAITSINEKYLIFLTKPDKLFPEYINFDYQTSPLTNRVTYPLYWKSDSKLDPYLLITPNFYSPELEIKGKQILIPETFPEVKFSEYFTVR
jgi:hypothetical protein